MDEKKKWSVMLVAYLGNLTLAEWQTLIALIGGVLFIAYTGMQAFVFWRDKVRRHGGRSGDTVIDEDQHDQQS